MADALSREPRSEGCRPGEATTPGASARLSRRTFLKLAAAGAGSAALAACGPSIPQPAPGAGRKVQLVYQDSRAEWFVPMVQEMLEVFHSRQPNIRVFYTPEPDGPENIQEKTLAAMQTGTAPDVFQGCCSWFPIWAQKGYIMDLRPFVAADLDRATLDEWDAAQYRALATRDGLQYGLPKFLGALALYYNKDLFDRYGVDYPDESWDHDHYLEAMKRLTHDLDGDGKTDLWGSMTYVTWDRIQIHVNGWGGHLVDPDDDTRIRMGEPEALGALEWLRARMHDDRVMATMLDTQNAWPSDAFAAGRLAMVEDGSWALKSILSKANFRVGIAPFPAGPIRRVTLATNDGFGIYAGTKHPEAAWELMKFLTGEEFGRAMARVSFLQPARASLVDDWVRYVREQYPAKAGDANIAAFADGQIKGYSVTSEVAANMADAARMAHAAWDRILTLGQAPASSMEGVAQEIQRAQRG
jgi:multiple sugar transport system substrate-binding protein